MMEFDWDSLLYYDSVIENGTFDFDHLKLKVILNETIDKKKIDFLILGKFLNCYYYVNNSLQDMKKVGLLTEFVFGKLWRIEEITLQAFSIDKKKYSRCFGKQFETEWLDLRQ